MSVVLKASQLTMYVALRPPSFETLVLNAHTISQEDGVRRVVDEVKTLNNHVEDYVKCVY